MSSARYQLRCYTGTGTLVQVQAEVQVQNVLETLLDIFSKVFSRIFSLEQTTCNYRFFALSSSTSSPRWVTEVYRCELGRNQGWCGCDEGGGVQGSAVSGVGQCRAGYGSVLCSSVTVVQGSLVQYSIVQSNVVKCNVVKYSLVLNTLFGPSLCQKQYF